MNRKSTLCYFLVILSIVAGMGLAGHAYAQVQSAGDLFVNVDATVLSDGTLTSIPNSGSLGGVFEARGGGTTVPFIGLAGGTRSIRLDGGDFLQLVSAVGGSLIAPPAGLVGLNPNRTIEVWVLNPTIDSEETMVSWGHRGGPAGSNLSFNYGNNGAYGAIGHWDYPDIGWVNAGGAPAAGKWHLLVYTYDGTTTRVYADGVLANSEVLGAGVINTYANTSINLGAQLESDGVTVTGGLRGSLAIGRVRIHDGVLTDAQVLNNYNVERADFIDAGDSVAPLSGMPVHQYSFREAATSDATDLAFADSTGSANGVVRGAGAQFTGSKLVLPGGSSATQAYGDLPNGLLSENSANNFGSGEFSFEGWVRVTGNRSWSRIFDFGSTSAGELTGPGGAGDGLDYFFYSAQIGGTVTSHQLELRNEDPPGGGDIATAVVPSVGLNTDLHLVVTWDEQNGEIRAYENGQEVAAILADDPMSDINDVNVWLGRSNWTGDQNMQGEFDEVRLYDRVLTPAEVRGNRAAGPDVLTTAEPVSFTLDPEDQNVREFGTAVFMVALRGQPPITLQWYKNNVAIAGATSTILTLSNVQLSDNGAQIYCKASNDSGGPVTVNSAVAILRVSSDITPPQLTALRLHTLASVEVVFSEAILAEDAVNLAHFTLSGPGGPVTLLSAQPMADPARVVLTADGPLPGGSLTVSVTGVRDASVLQNEIAPGSTASFFYMIPGGVTHLYNFNGLAGPAPNGTVLPDLVGGADGVVKGDGVLFTGDDVALTGGPSASAPYIDLPNGLLSNNSTNRSGSGQVSLECWLQVTGSRTWSRVFDIGSTVGGELTAPGGGGEGLDYLALSAQIGDDTGNHRFVTRNEDPAGGGGEIIADYGSTTFNTESHFVVTWNEATGIIKSFENGVEKATLTTDDPMSDINDVNVWLGRSNWTADQNTQGEYNEFRVYDRVLTPEDVSQNYSAGLANNYGQVAFLNLSVDKYSMEVGESQQVGVTVDFELAFNVNLTGSPCITYASSDPGVLAVDGQGWITAMGPGNATVSASFSGLVEFLPITVVLTPVSFAAHPADQTVDEYGTAIFTVTAQGSLPIGFRWFKNNVPIAGATSPTLTLRDVSYLDNGASITCLASNYTTVPVTVTSHPAILTVNPDLVAPELTGARLATMSSILLIFSERVRAADAMNLANFSLTGPEGAVALLSAERTTDPARVLLTAASALPCGLLTVAVSGVHDVSGTGNVVASGSTATVSHIVPGGLTHLYNFNNVPGAAASGSAVLDVVGGANGVVLGTGASFTGDRVSLPGGSSASAAYVDLPNGLLSANSANNGGSGEVSVEGWVRITGSRTWSRIFDIGSSDIGGGVGGEVTGPGGGGEGLDYFFLSAQVGDDTATHRIEVRNEDPRGGGVMTGDFASSAFQKDTHFVVTWDESTGQISAYENGVPQGSVTVDDDMSDIHDVNVWLGRSNWTGDQNMQGEFDEFRVYDRVLTPAEVANNFTVGAENNYGALTFFDITVGQPVMEAGQIQQATVVASFERAPDVNMTGSPCVDYSTSDASVVTVNPSGMIQAVGGGTATVAARLLGQQETVSITVRVTNEPPVARDDIVICTEDITMVAASGLLLLNDTDLDGDPLTTTLASPPGHGTVTLRPDGGFTYEPAPNFNGVDSFTYVANDGQANSAPATVTITVQPVNDPPVCSAASATTDEDVAVAITLPASDVDGDPLTYWIVSLPAQGTVSVAGDVATYQGNLNYNGTDSFTFKVSDPSGAESGVCTVSVTIRAVNDPPVAVIEVRPVIDLGPSVPGINVASPNNVGACVVLDGSKSSDVDNAFQDLTFLWLVDGEPAGTGVLVENLCLPVGAREVTLIVNDGADTGQAVVVVNVLTPSECIDELILQVNNSVIARKNKQPLIASLKAASAAVERGNFKAGANILNAFVNKTRAQVAKDNPDIAAEWIRIAQAIMGALASPQDCDGCE